jgi:tryptophan-rich sensory protein
MAAFGIGGALAGLIANSDQRTSGIVAGALMWAVALVAGNVLSGYVGTHAYATSSAWTPLFAALLSFGAAVVGGMLGASLHATRHIRSVDATPVG